MRRLFYTSDSIDVLSRDAPTSEKRPILIFIFFRGPIPIPVNTESKTCTGKTESKTCKTGFSFPYTYDSL